jgi:hypothetical protein
MPIRAEVRVEAACSPTASIRDEQIHSLVQQLFFRHEAGLVRNVGFAPVDASTQTAQLCLQVATALAEEGNYDVGLIDASSDPVLLQQQLQIPAPTHDKVTWAVSPRLWFVPRQSWWREGRLQLIADHNVEQLRELMAGFDFSILCCAPISWLTARIGQSCDGLVLVLTANKTRRLVAAQVKDHLHETKVPLLGTILVERRFPVPQGLYRNL